jgi:hypothetical protein
VLLGIGEDESAGVALLGFWDEPCVVALVIIEVEDESELLVDSVEEKESEHADADADASRLH